MKEPDTDCEDCWRAEATIVQRARAALRRLDPLTAYERALNELTMIMIGGRAPSWYERHRERWEATGDLAEFERMLRHIT